MKLHSDFLTRPLAHRTLHDVRKGRPENSRSGAEAAIAAGYGLEIDLQLSSDGVPMVFHDDCLQRLTRSFGAVRDLSAADLRATRLTHGDEGIPDFEEFLALVGGRVPVLVELKDQDGGLGPNTDVLEQASCDLLRHYQGKVALMSFNPHSVAKCAEYAPDIARGLVTGLFSKGSWPDVADARRKALAQIPDYERVGACFISHNRAHLNHPPVVKLRDAGETVLCWTVKSPEQEAATKGLVDNITFEGYLA